MIPPPQQSSADDLLQHFQSEMCGFPFPLHDPPIHHFILGKRKRELSLLNGGPFPGQAEGPKLSLSKAASRARNEPHLNLCRVAAGQG